MLRQMTVSGLTIDPFTNSPIMILKDVDSDKAVPIWIGLLEATAIASELENIKFSRPMTHDLLKIIMETMAIQVTRVEVCDLRDNTYFALIYLTREGQEVTIDARPSDAIALALRVKAPIFVAEVVIQKARRVDLSAKEAITTEDAKKWTEILEGLDPDDSERLLQTIKGPKQMVVYQDSRHSVGNVPAANLGPFPPILVADWMAERFAGKPFMSERWYVTSSGQINKTPF